MRQVTWVSRAARAAFLSVTAVLLTGLLASCGGGQQTVTPKAPRLPGALLSGDWMTQEGDVSEPYRKLYALYLGGTLATDTSEAVRHLVAGSRRKGTADGLVPVFYDEKEGRNVRTFFGDVEGVLPSDESREALLVLAWRLMTGKDDGADYSEGTVVFSGMAYVARTAEAAVRRLTSEGRDADVESVKAFLEELRTYKRERQHEIEERLRARHP